ncbi:MAG: hemolysin III family protein [Thermoguttaceae bacterium]|nr:hemolysin III family protein [Thermoguttaceae bacterium]
MYTLGEEIANSITHGVGACLTIAALALLVVRAATRGGAGHVVGYSIFGASLLILYLSSTIYHSLTPPRAKAVFQVLDHSSIYLLIAGTYTAYCLGPMYSGEGWWVFGTIWALAIVGTVAYAVYRSKAQVFSTILYLIMGWFVLLVAGQLKAALPNVSWIFLIIGGASYTVGALFFLMKRVRWMHSIWHLFVLGGSISHFFSLFWAI